MRDFFKKLRAKAKKAWLKVKAWVLGLLVALGLVSAPLLYAEVVDFNYDRATLRSDGTVLLESDIAFTRLYCDGVMVDEEVGADESFQTDLGIGTHNCHATHVDTDGQESLPSNVVVKTVNPAAPNPPENLSL